MRWGRGRERGSRIRAGRWDIQPAKCVSRVPRYMAGAQFTVHIYGEESRGIVRVAER